MPGTKCLYMARMASDPFRPASWNMAYTEAPQEPEPVLDKAYREAQAALVRRAPSREILVQKSARVWGIRLRARTILRTFRSLLEKAPGLPSDTFGHNP
jgi:hypothetical protein